MTNDPARIQIHPEAPSYGADVHFAPFRHLVPGALASDARLGKPGHDDGLKNLPWPQCTLAVGDEELVDRESAFFQPVICRICPISPIFLRHQHHVGIEREQYGGAVADGGGCDEVAAHGGTVANLAGAENPKHVGQRWELFCRLLLDLGEGNGSADAPFGIGALDLLQFRHRFHGYERGKPLEALGNIEPYFSGAGNEPALGELRQQLQQAAERSWPEEPLPGELIIDPSQSRRGLLQSLGEWIISVLPVPLGEGLDGRLANRSVAGAAAEIAA
jgi:hypothetical protein